MIDPFVSQLVNGWKIQGSTIHYTVSEYNLDQLFKQLINKLRDAGIQDARLIIEELFLILDPSESMRDAEEWIRKDLRERYGF